MAPELPANPKYHDTMAHLEDLRRVSGSGSEYWFAREIQPVLGYSEWRGFNRVMERALASMLANEIEPSHHIVETTRMMEVGKGAMREERDFFLSRAACYLIAMNGIPSKPEIAAAQAYFAVQTRAREVESGTAEDEKRLELREKVKESFKAVSGAAKQAGVTNPKQPIFHDARYKGLYGMSAREMKSAKGMKLSDPIGGQAKRQGATQGVFFLLIGRGYHALSTIAGWFRQRLGYALRDPAPVCYSASVLRLARLAALSR